MWSASHLLIMSFLVSGLSNVLFSSALIISPVISGVSDAPGSDLFCVGLNSFYNDLNKIKRLEDVLVSGS